MPLDVEPVAGSLQPIWYRHSRRGADPYQRPDPPPDSRWQRGAVVDALYLASDEATVWAEWYRHLAELSLPPMAQLPRDFWRWRLAPNLRLADLRTADRLQRVGLSAPTPTRRDWARYQVAGESLSRDGWDGLVAPSAARPRDGLIVCIFCRGRVRGAVPLPPPRSIVEPPAPPIGMTT